jgi:glutathione S-transferase
VKLFQIPFSHNSIKVRRVLALKGLEYERENVNPALRGRLKKLSGQELTPVLVDGDRVIPDSTAIITYLEEAYPEPPLLPEDPEERARCLVLEDWADRAFMALTRRLAYGTILQSDTALGDLFFPKYPRPVRRVAGRAAILAIRHRFGLSEKQGARDQVEALRVAKLAVGTLGGRQFLVGDRITLADIALAAMSAPLQIAPPAVRQDADVNELLAWGQTVLEGEFTPGEVVAALP